MSMNNRSNDNSEAVLAIVGIVAVLVAIGIWKLSKMLELTPGATVSLLLGFLLSCAFAAAFVWWEDELPEMLHIENVWPIALVIFWMGLCPALNVWSGADYLDGMRQYTASRGGINYSIYSESEVAFYGKWYFQWGVPLLLVISFYGYKYAQNRSAY